MSSSRSLYLCLIAFLIVAHLLPPTTSAQESLWEWTDQSGKFRVKAEFESIEKDAVVLNKADGTQIRVPLNRLSKEDRDYLKNQTTESSSDSENKKNKAKVPVSQILKSPVSFSLAKQPVGQGLNRISEELSINIFLSPREAQESGSVGLNREIEYTPSGQSLETALDSILTPLQLAWSDFDGVLLITSAASSPMNFRALNLENVRAKSAIKLILQPCGLCAAETDGTISITSKEKAKKNLITAEHNISGILGNNLSPILLAIEKVIDPDSWQSRGGKASFMVKGPDSISVTQTSENHSAIRKLISDLRESSR